MKVKNGESSLEGKVSLLGEDPGLALSGALNWEVGTRASVNSGLWAILLEAAFA